MHRSQILMIYVLVASVLVASTFAVITIQKNVPGEGSIKGVGLDIYWDPQCTDETSSIDFGLLEAGSYKDFTLYLESQGNTDLTLSMTAQDWNPTEASNYLSLTWNREGQKISPDQVMSFVLRLSVSPNIQDISSFSLLITIYGTG